MTKAEYYGRYKTIMASDIIKALEKYADKEDVSPEDIVIKLSWADIEAERTTNTIAEFPMVRDCIGGKHNPPTKAIRIVAIK